MVFQHQYITESGLVFGVRTGKKIERLVEKPKS